MQVLLCTKLNLKKTIIMKNLFKFGFLAIAVSLSVAACNTNKSEGDTTDTTVLGDTTMMDTTMMDTTMADTTM